MDKVIKFTMPVRHNESTLQCVAHDDPILRGKVAPFTWVYPDVNPSANPFDQIDAGIILLRRQSDAMQLLLRDTGFWSLAANQVGLPIRMLVIDPYLCGLPDSAHAVYVNPNVVAATGSYISLDTCPNFEGLRVEIMRPSSITVEAQKVNGDTFSYEFEGEGAAKVLRAIDALNGFTILDRSCIGKTGYKAWHSSMAVRLPGVPSRGALYATLKERSDQLKKDDTT